MPTINLGNIKTITAGLNRFEHTVTIMEDATKVHAFTGVTGGCGYCKCVDTFTEGDTIEINESAYFSNVAKPHLIQKDAYIIFAAPTDEELFIFSNSRYYDNVIPDGSTVTPVNSVEIWCNCIGVNWYDLGCPTARDLAYSKYSELLFTSENALNYYQRSNEIIANTINVDNVHKRLAENSNYHTIDTVFTSNTFNGYELKSSQAVTNGTFDIFKMFDNNLTTYYQTKNSVNNFEIEVITPEPMWVSRFTIRPQRTLVPAGDTFTVQVSADGADWETMCVRDGGLIANVPMTFFNQNGLTGKYQYIKFIGENTTSAHIWQCFDCDINGLC